MPPPPHLPADLWRLILSFLSRANIAKVARVCRAWTELAYFPLALSIPSRLVVPLELPAFEPPPSLHRSQFGSATRCEQDRCEFAGTAQNFGFCSGCIKGVPADVAIRQRHLVSWTAKRDEDAKAQSNVRHTHTDTTCTLIHYNDRTNTHTAARQRQATRRSVRHSPRTSFPVARHSCTTCASVAAFDSSPTLRTPSICGGPNCPLFHLDPTHCQGTH